jgi:hypothetical protein
MAGITDKEVRALISKAQREGKALYQADGFVPGLTLSASKTGVASWYLRFRWAGKQKEVTIGQYPAWGIADAREKAKELRRAVDIGVDVAVEKQMTKLEAVNQMTVDALAASYFEKAEKELHAHTFKQRKSVHARFVSPEIGTFPADAVTPAHVVEIVRKSLEGGKTLPRIVLLHVTQLYRAWGVSSCAGNDSAPLCAGDPPNVADRRSSRHAERIKGFRV